MRTIAVINQKGGVGKTTTVANLGAALALRGLTVCLLDLDPQAHLTLHFGVEPGQPEHSIYDVLVSDAPFLSTVLGINEHLMVVPSVIDLAAAEVELVTTVGREQILRDSLRNVELPCDLMMIDCPPSLGLLTLNALAAADDVVIPLQPHFLALQGLGKLLETVGLVRQRINPNLRVSGVLLCMYETATRLAGEVVQDLRAFFDASRGQDAPWADARLFDTVIRRNIKLAECPSHGQAIFDYDRSSNGATDYGALADEFIEHFQLPVPRRSRKRKPSAPRAAAEPPQALSTDADPQTDLPDAEDAAIPPAVTVDDLVAPSEDSVKTPASEPPAYSPAAAPFIPAPAIEDAPEGGPTAVSATPAPDEDPYVPLESADEPTDEPTGDADEGASEPVTSV